MTTREAGNWLRAYLEYTDDSESPENFHVWTALSCLAAVTRRRTWLHQGIYILFSNLFVALVGPPARTAKGTAMRAGRKLISEVPGVSLGPDACTVEELIRQFAESKIDNQCCMTIHSPEFSSLLEPSGVKMLQFLTDLYDCDYDSSKGWKYATKTSGKDTIVNPFLNVLFCTTPTYIADAMPDNIIGHGFTSRTVFVYEDRERKSVTFPRHLDPTLRRALINDLNRIAGLGGEFRWDDPNAAQVNLDDPETWGSGRRAYHEFYMSLAEAEPEDHRLQGYHWRKKIHVLKIAILLSLAERDELVLDEPVITAAVQLLHNLEASMARTFSAVGKYEFASDLERIGSLVARRGEVSTEEIYGRNYFVGDSDRLQAILASLVRMGVIRLERKNGHEVATSTRGALPWQK